VVGVAFSSALFFFGVLFTSGHQVTGTFLGMLFGLLIALAPLCYVVGAKSFLRPTNSGVGRAGVAMWQWTYYGLCGGAALVLIIDLFTREPSPGLYGIWIGVLLFLDFLGRSLFASVATAQFVLSNIRAALVAQAQFAKVDQGATLEARLVELEPVCGKM
jgi:hypothetical protein